MEIQDKTKEQLINELRELQKTHNSLKSTVEKESGGKKDEDAVLKRLILAAEEFIGFTDDIPDYNKILQIVLDISGAKYASLNIFDENGLSFTTVEMKGINKNILKGLDFLGFDVKNKHWKHDPVRAEKTKDQTITRFMHLHELTGDVIPKNVIYLIEKTFGIEETFVVKIVKDDKVSGDFTLLFEKGETLKNNSFVELYASQVCLFLERHKLTNLLKNSEGKYRMLVENLNEIIYTLDKDGKITYVSSNIEKISGYTAAEVVGKSFIDFMNPENLNKPRELLRKTISGINRHSEYHMLSKSGRSRWVRTRVKPLVKEGRFNGVQGVLTDITDLKESETKLKRLNVDKDRFISILSHDLKSPFNIILGFSELLTNNLHEYSIKKVGEYVNHINKATQNANNLLEDLLKWARVQQGSISFNPQKLIFADICEEIVKTLKPNADAKNIKINCSATNHLFVFADEDMLKTILRNLVSNAIKFTNNGGAINITAGQTDTNITITVSDNGMGISPENLKKLFDISEVLTTKGTAKETGTGLGLLLCKEFTEKHGGEIWVKSQEGKGSEFYFTIPHISDEGLKIYNKKGELRDYVNNDQVKKLKILIAEDDITSVKLLTELVKSYSENILYAWDGVEAVELCKKNPDIDLVLMDIKMPKMDGYEAAREIRQFNKDVVIIAQTAHVYSEEKAKTSDAGYNDYITKPVNQGIFNELIQEYFKNR
ncbi:MAG: PAS domain S-box protein [Bacteroidales bacterium]